MIGSLWTHAFAGVSERVHDPRGWAPASVRMLRTGYGRWLTCLDATGRLDNDQTPDGRVTRDCLSSYVADLERTDALLSVIARVEQLAKALRVMEPNGGWTEVQREANALRRWLKAAERVDHPRDVAVRRSLPIAEWPEPDRAAWAAATTPGDRLEPEGVATGWKDATQGAIADSYGYWLHWLDREGLLDRKAGPGDRAQRDVLTRYLAELRQGVAPFTLATRISGLGAALHVMVPAVDWGWLRRAGGRLRLQASPVRNKRGRLQTPAELIALGQSLMTRAESGKEEQARWDAALYRDGLLIAFLASRPIRRKNLAAITVGRHLLRAGEG